MNTYRLFTRSVHTFRRNVHEPGSRGSRLFSCLPTTNKHTSEPIQKRKIVCQTPAIILNQIPTYLQPSDPELDNSEPIAKEPSERTFHLKEEDKEALVKLTLAYMS